MAGFFSRRRSLTGGGLLSTFRNWVLQLEQNSGGQRPFHYEKTAENRWLSRRQALIGVATATFGCLFARRMQTRVAPVPTTVRSMPEILGKCCWHDRVDNRATLTVT